MSDSLEVLAAQLLDLHVAATAINAADSPDEALQTAANYARQITGAELAIANLLVGRESHTTSQPSVASDGNPDVNVPALVERAGQYEVLLRDRVVARLGIAGDKDADQGNVLPGMGTRGWLVAALPARSGRRLGLVALVGSSGREFSKTDEAIVVQIAQVAAAAIEHMWLEQNAQEALARSSEFVAMVSHDLKNPLTAIRGHTQLLERYVRRGSELDTTRVMSGLVKIEDTTQRMVMLINELQDLARIQASQPLELYLAETDVVALARRMVTEYQQLNPEHRVHLINSREALPGHWDPIRLERVLGNLLSNAIKYSPSGGEITLDIEGDDERAILRVRDQGIGIPKADLPQVFERYHRASNVPAGVGGTGLGLAGARQIVEQHGGSISVESEEGGGTTFTVELPSQTKDQEQEAA